MNTSIILADFETQVATRQPEVLLAALKYSDTHRFVTQLWNDLKDMKEFCEDRLRLNRREEDEIAFNKMANQWLYNIMVISPLDPKVDTYESSPILYAYVAAIFHGTERYSIQDKQDAIAGKLLCGSNYSGNKRFEEVYLPLLPDEVLGKTAMEVNKILLDRLDINLLKVLPIIMARTALAIYRLPFNPSQMSAWKTFSSRYHDLILKS